ncbi:MAG: TetR family transcriptional regulator [Actinomycetes bacterium]
MSATTGDRRGPGRRPGHEDTRGTILEAARRSFAEHGYDGSTVRGIARDADVDPALVHHYFGGKEQVFVAAMALPFEPSVVVPQILGDGPDGVGERFVRFFLGVWGDPESRDPFLGLLRSATTNEEAATMMREFVSRALLGRVADALDLPDAALRVEASASHLIGLALLRYVIKVEPLASASEEEVVALVAPTIQRYMTGG